MEEIIKYFESLEARIAALEEAQQTNEAVIASLEAEVEELKNLPQPEPQVIEKIVEKIVEKPVEVVPQNNMEEIIKYFESLEARIAALEEAQQTNEAVIASLEAEVEELKNLPQPEPQVIEKIVEKIVEKPVEVVPQKPVEEPKPEPIIEEPVVIKEEPVVIKEEPVSPKAAIYGKAVDDIRLAISLGDRFLYQRELFGQNAELMQRTLTELNELGSFDEAINYISRFNWDTESNSYQQFIVTLHRRFG